MSRVNDLKFDVIIYLTDNIYFVLHFVKFVAVQYR